MFKRVKRATVFVALVAVLASLFGAAVSVWADGESLQTRAGDYLEGSGVPPTNSRDNSTKEITTGSTSPDIHVTLVVEAGNLEDTEEGKFWVSHDVTLPAPASGDYTVTDLLVEVNSDSSYDLLFLDTGGSPITSQSTYFSAVTHAGTTWKDGALVYGGWQFRVNDKFPVFNDGTGQGWTGDSILQARIVSGDIVHAFYDVPADVSGALGSLAANYVKGARVSATSSTLTVQLHGHTTYIGPQISDPPMYVDNYKNLQAGVTAYLYDAAGTTLINTRVSDVHGQVVFSGSFPSGSTYIVKTDPVYYPAQDLIEDYVDAYIALTGAYSKISR